MTYEHDDAVVSIFNLRVFEPKLPHCLKSGVQTFTNVFIRWIRKFINHSHDRPITSELFVQNVFFSYMTG